MDNWTAMETVKSVFNLKNTNVKKPVFLFLIFLFVGKKFNPAELYDMFYIFVHLGSSKQNSSQVLRTV